VLLLLHLKNLHDLREKNIAVKRTTQIMKNVNLECQKDLEERIYHSDPALQV